MTHTPGPWVAVEAANFKRLNVFSVKTQADIDSGFGHRDLIKAGSGLDEADARLIAAAPDLLAASKVIMAWVNTQIYAGMLPEGLPFQAIRAAIAKAEGRWEPRKK